MTRHRTSLLTLCIVMACCTRVHAQYLWESLSEADAIAAVRQFEGEPALSVTSDGLSVLDFDDPAMFGQMMSAQAAEIIAIAFMQSHFPAPQVRTNHTMLPMGPDDVRDPDPGFVCAYAVSFTQDCGRGVVGPSRCYIVVDTVFGRVVDYSQCFYPVLVPVVPALSGSQAMTAAMNALLTDQGEAGTLGGLYISHPDALGVERLAYSLSIVGTGPAGLSSYFCHVDAFTSAVLGWDVPAGARRGVSNSARQAPTSPRKCTHPPALRRYRALVLRCAGVAPLTYAPLLVHNRAYLFGGYLCSGDPTARKSYHGPGDIRVAGKDRDLRFSTTSTRRLLNGQKRTLPAKPVILNGRTYVPIEAAQGVLPFRVTCDATTKMVRFDALPTARH